MSNTSTFPTAGLFEHHADIGTAGRAGGYSEEAAKRRCTLSGGGTLWGDGAGSRFAWNAVEGPCAIEAAFEVPARGAAGLPGCLMLRAGPGPESTAAAAFFLPGGRAILQTKEEGGELRELVADVDGCASLRLECRGGYVSLSTAEAGRPFRPTGGSVRLPLAGPVLLGVAAWGGLPVTFSDVVFTTPRPGGERLLCALEIMDVATGSRRIVLRSEGHIEAPNWSRDGASLIFNGGGRLFRVPAHGGASELLDTGFAVHCNNDHGLSPDGSLLAISDHTEEGRSLIYTLPAGGGDPVRVTAHGPSYWHGWSPDGRMLAYCAEREGRFGIFTIPAKGGEERRLTTAAPGGLDDGPDYSPDGAWIYFNSDRSGLMQIWRIQPDGTGLERVTTDAFNDWFAHPSPDGRSLVVLSYGPEVHGHPANKDVCLRLMPVGGGEARVLARFFGGQGTINVPSWSPDSRRIAYVTYQLLPGP